MDGFGERLVAARKKKGYSQKQLAQLLDITPTRLNYWEKDKREPDFFMFCKIVQLLDADANELLGLSMKKQELHSLDAYNTLNPTGKKKADEYIKDLADNKKYTEKENNTSISEDIASELNVAFPVHTKHE